MSAAVFYLAAIGVFCIILAIITGILELFIW